MDEEEKLEVSERLGVLEMLFDGMCPNCKQIVGFWHVPQTRTVREEMRNIGVDWKTGHLLKCNNK